MSYVFNSFTGNFDIAPSTTKGNDAYTYIFTNSSFFFTSPVVTPLTGDGTTTVFDISGAENLDNPGAIIVTIDGALQEPVYSYTVSNNVLTFTSPPASGTRIFTTSPNGTRAVGILTGDSRIFSAYNSVNALSTNWTNAYYSVCALSAVWGSGGGGGDEIKRYVHTNFLPLTGGTVTENTVFNKNVTIFGDLSCSGTQTFANTVFSTTSALSVVHFGSGDALWVGNNGDGHIASFNDIDQNIEILHVGGDNSEFPNVGVRTGTPNVEFTVNGDISSNKVIYDNIGNSNDWNNVYSDVRAGSADWKSVYTTVHNTSANSWDNEKSNQYTHTNFLPLTGGTISGNLSVIPTSEEIEFIKRDTALIIKAPSDGGHSRTSIDFQAQNYERLWSVTVDPNTDGEGNLVVGPLSGDINSSQPYSVNLKQDNNHELTGNWRLTGGLTVRGSISASGDVYGNFSITNPPITLVFGHSSYTPAANTSVHIASFSDLIPLLVTSTPQRYVTTPSRGLIDIVTRMFFNTVTNGSGEFSTLSLVNITQNLSTLIANDVITGNGTTAGRSQHNRWALAQPLTAEQGDLLAIRWDTANWVTSPSNSRGSYNAILRPF